MPGDTSTLPPPSGPPLPLAPPARRRSEVVWAQLGPALVAGAVGAALAFGHAPGIGWAAAAVALTAGVLLGRRRTPAGPVDAKTGVDRTWRAAVATCAVALALQPAVTDAGWVLAVCLLASAALAVLAAAGGRTWVGSVLVVPRTLLAALGGLAAARRRIALAARRTPRAGRRLRTAAVTVGLLALFGSLFASADAAFAGLLDLLTPDLSVGGIVGRVLLATVLATIALTLVLLAPRPEDDVTPPAQRVWTGSEWLVPVGGLVALFAVFVSVQLGTSFGGDEFVRRTAGTTYAGHAREGFAQLLTVAILTLLVLAVTGRYAVARTAAEARLRRTLLAALCALTLVVLASAFHRLSLYEAAYGYTPARLTARATILWIGAVFALVLVAGALRRVDQLPRATVLLTAVSLLVFALVRPDALIARWNVDRFVATGRLDAYVLATLSADAAPALAELPPEVRACVGRRTLGEVAGLGWNLARARANELPAADAASCQPPPGSEVEGPHRG